MEQINQSSGIDPLVQGLAAFLFAALHGWNDDSQPHFSRASLHALVTSRIGADLYLSRVQRFKESKAFSAVLPEIYGVLPTYSLILCLAWCWR